MASTLNIPAVILAGGASTRMGRDKAMMPLDGVPMLHRMARTALETCSKVLIVGREKPADWPVAIAADFIPDISLEGSAGEGTAFQKKSGGPLVGLVTALEHFKVPALLLSCDLPLLSGKLLRRLVAAHPPVAWATMAAVRDGGELRAEPMLAVYAPALLPALREMLRENRRSLQALVQLAQVATWAVPEEFLGQLLNVNDAEAAAHAEALLRERGE